MSENSSDEWSTNQPQLGTSQPERPVKTMADLLFLPESECRLMKWLLQQKSANLAEVAAFLAHDESDAQAVLDRLLNQGFVRLEKLDEQVCYQPCLASRKGRQVPSNIWKALDS